MSPIFFRDPITFGSWDYRKLAIVSLGLRESEWVCDRVSRCDFAEMAALLRPAPKVIWLRVGNQSAAVISILLRRHADLIAGFGEGRRRNMS
jgi:hypothetical protein